jgi:hypothetical protein
MTSRLGCMTSLFSSEGPEVHERTGALTVSPGLDVYVFSPDRSGPSQVQALARVARPTGLSMAGVTPSSEGGSYRGLNLRVGRVQFQG